MYENAIIKIVDKLDGGQIFILSLAVIICCGVGYCVKHFNRREK